MIDHLLVVGPGRSGSDFLFRILRSHPDYAFPEIKEGAYYRSMRRYRRASTTARRAGRLLCDISNDAYRDTKLLPGIRALQRQGVSILVVVLLRNHRDRAVSAIRFRRSRGRPSVLLGARHLEEVVVRDRLTEERLEEIFDLDVDVLTVDFSTLVGDTERFLAKLASLCRTKPFDTVETDPVNVSTEPRLAWLSTVGWLCAVALRKMGMTRLLQRIKDSPAIGRMFFKPPATGRSDVRLSDRSLRILDHAHRECWSLVTRLSAKEQEGVFVRRRPTKSAQ